MATTQGQPESSTCHTPSAALPLHGDASAVLLGGCDLAVVESLSTDSPLDIAFSGAGVEAGVWHFRIYHLQTIISLSEMLPVLESLGLRVLAETTGRHDAGQGVVWIHDLVVQYDIAGFDDDKVQRFRASILACWQGRADADGFNRLVLSSAGLTWQQVAVLRTYARYTQQTGFALHLSSIEQCLLTFPAIAGTLFQLFDIRMSPALDASERDNAEQDTRLLFEQQMRNVMTMTDDRILRCYENLVSSTLRTNFYTSSNVLALKLDGQLVNDMPAPRPQYEIFVSSPRVEGVHLRLGLVARGGIRWSDRNEDFRTEILGLVKAQQVKNAVIVPSGAKGGFVLREHQLMTSREKLMEEGTACYRTFIDALLSITDNIVEGCVIHPQQVYCHDGDDPYMVVAADKGTAHFSDMANEISLARQFWLGDAFASGGKHGYDHKKIGITARGAWIATIRHLQEMGINTDNDTYTVVGIGDMSGDVFGNGMLLSRKMKLVAAFSRSYIFIDPDPDPELSWKERKRLFDMPRSTWADYNKSLISAGGGVFLREIKSIAISAEMKALFAISDDSLTPVELIRALLCSHVDILWNGGIGTYVKAHTESHSDAGDKANDSLRVDGAELGARIVIEGGNLGLTQKGRIEYALQGGRINTDFIDNAGGVNCSDHEVNIKIFLDQQVRRGRLSVDERNEWLQRMQGEVAELVLADNFRQIRGISVALYQSRERIGEYRRYIRQLESSGRLDRQVECIPGDADIVARHAGGRGLTRPELAMLMAYAKMELKDVLETSNIASDPVLRRDLLNAFPASMVAHFGDALYEHPLLQRIVSTQLANRMIDHMGITFFHRMQDVNDRDPADIARAFSVAFSVFDLEEKWLRIDKLGAHINIEVQWHMMSELIRVGRRATRWFMRNTPCSQAGELMARFSPGIARLAGQWPRLLTGNRSEQWQRRFDTLKSVAVPDAVAYDFASLPQLLSALGMIVVTEQSREPLTDVAQVYHLLGEQLKLFDMAAHIEALPVRNHWQAMAREVYRDDLEARLCELTSTVGRTRHVMPQVQARIERWCAEQKVQLQRWQNLIQDPSDHADGQSDFALYPVLLRELGCLTRRSV